jgi:TonB-linked SusC/RagA family outer membrane protein
MKLKFLLFLSMFFNVAAFATQVEGVVLDQNTKDPIIGASILVKGTSTGTITDLDGKFKINVADTKTATLLVSYVGYQKKNVNLDGKTMITVLLEEDAKTLEEVVVVGYGTMRKSDLTGSIVSIKTKEDEAARSASVDKMLQGKAAGLSVTTGSAAPGGAVNVKIRGTGSLRGDNSPLYVVDGNIISMDETIDPMSQGNGGGNSLMDKQNPLSQISPQDIESIEVLKDASATAIYGSQGANGVILITTKQGVAAKPKVTFSTNLTSSKMYKKIPVLNTEEYISFYNGFLTEGQALKTMDGVNAVDWQDEVMRTSFSQNHRISLSGKSNKTSYYLAGGYMNNQGIVRKTGIQQADFRINLDQDITDKLSLKSNTFYSRLNTTMTSGTDKLANVRSSAVRHMISFKPIRGEAVEESYDEELTGPDAWMTDYDDDSQDNNFNTNLTLNYKASKAITFQLKGGYISRYKERSLWYGTGIFNGAQVNGKAGVSGLKSEAYNAEAMMMFNKKYGKHNISGTIGSVYNYRTLTSTSITGENFFSKSLRAKGITQAATLYPFLYREQAEELFSILGRGVYSYADKYVLTATFRADGSSKFSANNRFSYFPSFAFAWRANQEKFLKDVDAISNLKFRAGWGQVGNQAVAPYQILMNYNTVFYVNPNGSSAVGIAPGVIANPNLKWETSEQTNLGFDLGLFKQALSLTVDVYEKNTKDLLQEIAIPYLSGKSSMWVNNGSIRNRGLEITLEGTPVNKKNLKVNLSGNISFQQSTIMDLGMSAGDFGMLKNVRGYLGNQLGNNNNSKFPVNIFLEGKPLGQYYGYATNGIMQQADYDAQDPTKRLMYNGADVRPGDVKFIDQNSDNVINALDQTIIGDPNPDFVYGFNANVTYKQFTLDMQFNGVQGNQIVNANLIEETDVTNSQKNVRKDAFYQAWTPENKSNTYPKLGYASTAVFTDRLLEDGSYLRLSSVTLSYLLKLKSKAVNSLQFNLTGSNLFVLTNYKGFDPDVNTFSNDVSRLGVDLTSYPSARHFTFGIIANF